MKKLKLLYYLLVASGALVIVLYCLFTVISWAFYPFDFGPLTHYLSRLGNTDYNTDGAIFYNLGCIVTGIFLIPFFISVSLWYTRSIPQRFMFAIGQTLGCFSGVALMMIGIYSEDQGAPHMTASSTFFLLNFFVLVFLSIGFLMIETCPKFVAIYGILFNLSVLGFAFTLGGPITEWFTVFGSLIFVALIVSVTVRRKQVSTSLTEKDTE